MRYAPDNINCDSEADEQPAIFPELTHIFEIIIWVTATRSMNKNDDRQRGWLI